MSDIMSNIQWVFSGVGVFVLSIIFYFLFQRGRKDGGKSIKIKSKGSDNEFNIEQK